MCVLSKRSALHTLLRAPFPVYFSYVVVVVVDAILMLFILHYFSVFGRFFYRSVAFVFIYHLWSVFFRSLCPLLHYYRYHHLFHARLCSNYFCSTLWQCFCTIWESSFWFRNEGSTDETKCVCIYWKQKATDNKTKKKHVFIFVSLYAAEVYHWIIAIWFSVCTQSERRDESSGERWKRADWKKSFSLLAHPPDAKP